VGCVCVCVCDCRYKKDLSVAVERQSELERSKAQLELDWQRRYEDVERLQYAHSEDLVKTLGSARNEVIGKLFLLWFDNDEENYEE